MANNKSKNSKEELDVITRAAIEAEESLALEAERKEKASRKRKERRKVYVRPKETGIPREVIEYFAKDDYELRWVRWSIHGEPSYHYLNLREQEGYEFVTKDELPPSFSKTLRIRDTQVSKGLVTNGGDLCLMKIDKDLRQSRRDYISQRVQEELNAVNANVLERKGLRDLGSRSRVSFREPSFKA